MQAIILEDRVGINEQSTVYLPISKRPAIVSLKIFLGHASQPYTIVAKPKKQIMERQTFTRVCRP